MHHHPRHDRRPVTSGVFRLMAVAFAIFGIICAGRLNAAQFKSITLTRSLRLVKNAGDGQYAVAGFAVAVPPSVKVNDINGNPVPRYPVIFTVASGDGSVTGATQLTGSDGIATVGSWTLGTAAGANTLLASGAGLTGSPLTFAATGTVSGAFASLIDTAPAGAFHDKLFVTQPKVKVVDASGNGINGIMVTVSRSTGSVSGTLSGTLSKQTGPDGLVTWSDLKLSGPAGSYTLTFTPSSGATVTAALTLGPGSASPATTIITSASSALPADGSASTTITVQLRDSWGNSLASSDGTVGLSTTGGTLGPVTDNNNGTYTATLTSSTTSGSYTVSGTLTLPGGSVSDIASTRTVVYTARDGYSITANSGASQSGIVGTAVGTPPGVIVRDYYNNPKSGVAVASGDGSISGANTTTGADGIATVGGWTLGTTVGSNTLTATATDLTGSPVTFTAAATHAALHHFTISPIDSSQSAGVPITGITLTAKDQYGNTVTEFTGPVTYSGTAGITGTSSAFIAGVLSNVSVTPTSMGSGRTFVVTWSDITNSSAPFDVNVGRASKLAFTTQPSERTDKNVAFDRQPVVAIQDEYGHTVTTATNSVTLLLNSGTLNGATSVSASSEVATFSGLSISEPRVGKVLTATADGLTSAVTSPTFTITAPLTAIGQISGLADVGSQLSPGALTPSGATVTYRWQSSTDGINYSDVSNNQSYTLNSGDRGKYVWVIATGTGAYTGSVTSQSQQVNMLDASLSTGLWNNLSSSYASPTLSCGGYTASEVHGVYYDSSVLTSAGGTFTESVLVKGKNSIFITLSVNDATKNNYASATFDLSNGVVSATKASGMTNVSATCGQSDSNGFRLCSLTFKTTRLVNVNISLSDKGSPSYDDYGRPTFAGSTSISVDVGRAVLLKQ